MPAYSTLLLLLHASPLRVQAVAQRMRDGIPQQVQVMHRSEVQRAAGQGGVEGGRAVEGWGGGSLA